MAHATENLERSETSRLIGSDKVDGTAVFRSDGEKIGTIDRVMIDKYTGKVAYAVMGFGGFMGMGEDHYPLPWSVLTYSERLDGYEVNVTDEQLKSAPRREDRDENFEPEWEKRIHAHYGVPGYWV